MAGMKRQTLVLLFAGVCLSLGSLAAQAQVNYIKIMPFGDSVTGRGSAPESSYRYWLWKDLTDAGFSNWTFIGNNNGVSDGGTPANSWPTEQWEGGDGWTSADGLNQAPSAANQNGGPDIVLLDFGSNDISPANIPLDQTEANLEQIIQDFAAQKPNVIVLIAKPTGWAPDPSSSQSDQRLQKREQSQLCGIVGKVAKIEKKAGIDVIAVNQFAGFNVKKDTVDGSHPNVIGEQKIASKYFKVLRKLMKRM